MSIIKTNEHLPFVQKKRNDHIFLFSRKTKFLKNKNTKEIKKEQERDQIDFSKIKLPLFLLFD